MVAVVSQWTVELKIDRPAVRLCPDLAYHAFSLPRPLSQATLRTAREIQKSRRTPPKTVIAKSPLSCMRSSYIRLFVASQARNQILRPVAVS